jgi:hypothetical protein
MGSMTMLAFSIGEETVAVHHTETQVLVLSKDKTTTCVRACVHVHGTRVGTQGQVLARQAFYHLSHISSPFLFYLFSDRV